MKKYDYIQIGIASPAEIRSWSYGEVKKHETINYRTFKPERDGLFCEVIFGPSKDYQCACGKSKRNTEKGKKCERCGVEITESKVRRERMGHIELAAPVVHTWYLRNSPSKISLMLDMKTRDIEDIVYLAAYIVTDPGSIEALSYGQILSEQEYAIYQREYGYRKFTALTGAEAIKKLLQQLDLEAEVNKLRKELKVTSKQKRERIIKRLEVVEAFYKSGNKPEWMVMDVIPVLPPDLRPMVQLDGGRFATTDLNDLYRRILNRNNRLRRQFEQHAPSLITKNEKRMLQEAVDSLIDNGKRNRRVVLDKNRPLKSLSDLLRGKQGRFRQNLLGKRVDYSGRSVIAVGPDLQMYQCGIPREMALILFKPFIINALMKKSAEQAEAGGTKISLKKAREMIEEGHPDALEQVEKIVVEHPVLLNRAPTLHRLGIQAFEPKLVEGKAIRLHPLVTPAFNADFDGDQMAVHVPLSEEAQAESRLLMLASKNILAPKDGKPIVTPSQDMVLGNYYLTIEDAHDQRNGKIFKDPFEAELAYENNLIGLHTRILLPVKSLDNPCFTEKQLSSYIITTYGKVIFNTIFPKGEDGIRNIPFINEENMENIPETVNDRFFITHEMLASGLNVKEYLATWIEVPEANRRKKAGVAYDKNLVIPVPFKKKFLSVLIAEVFKKFKLAETSKTLDKLKDLGFKYSTVSGITFSAYDITPVSTKEAVIANAENKIAELQSSFDLGLLNAKEKRELVIKEWNKAREILKQDIEQEVKENYINNHLYMMSDSGARGSVSNIVQLSGMRGIMAKPNGENMDIPIRSSFREGLTMSEFFISSHGSRKGSTDTALKTAESGYLTRRLVDVSQEVVVREDDCGTDRGTEVVEILEENPNKEHQRVIVSLKDRIKGRFTSKQVIDPLTNEVILEANQYIDDNMADEIVRRGITSVHIRTLLTCNAKNGVCIKCYGSDLSTGEVVEKGEVVGIIAAQSIGEPGTQLTMRTFHTGGVSGDDITQGLPRIQELFEAREPKGKAIISEVDGQVIDIIEEKDHRYEIHIEHQVNGRKVCINGIPEVKVYLTDSGKLPKVSIGDYVKAGERITEGLIHPKELLRVSTTEAVENYILVEVQKVYRAQGVEIADKHIEIIIKQMLQKVFVINEGDTEFLPGSLISKTKVYEAVKECLAKGLKPPVVKPVLLGITRASLKSDSFLSAASFQETTRVLTEAAIRGKRDMLEGLKENIVIGGLIPAGTGAIDISDENIIKHID